MAKNHHKTSQKAPHQPYMLYGYHSVIAALTNPKRVCHTLYMAEKYGEIIADITHQYHHLSRLQIIVKDNDFFNQKLPNMVHQSLLLHTEKLPFYSSDDTYSSISHQPTQTIIMLDQVMDSQNIGTIMRNALLLNADIIITPKNGSPDENPAICKAASGAFDALLYGRATNISRDIALLKKQNFWIYAFDSDGEHALPEIDFAPKSVLIFGNEHHGVRPNVKKHADIVAHIPMRPKVQNTYIESFNVASSVTMALYQRTALLQS